MGVSPLPFALSEVEGPFLFLSLQKEERGFDKLSPNGGDALPGGLLKGAALPYPVTTLFLRSLSGSLWSGSISALTTLLVPPTGTAVAA